MLSFLTKRLFLLIFIFLSWISFYQKSLKKLTGTATNPRSDTIKYFISDKHPNATNVITDKRHNATTLITGQDQKENNLANFQHIHAPGCGECDHPGAAASKLLREAPAGRELAAGQGELARKQLVAGHLLLLQLPHLHPAPLILPVNGHHHGVCAVAEDKLDVGNADRVCAILVRDGNAGVGRDTQIQLTLQRNCAVFCDHRKKYLDYHTFQPLVKIYDWNKVKYTK